MTRKIVGNTEQTPNVRLEYLLTLVKHEILMNYIFQLV